MVVSVNCGYAKDRSSFKTYRKVGISVQNYAAVSDMVHVAGIGTVELEVQAFRETGSPMRNLMMEKVLHIPDAICNGFAFIEYHKLIGSPNRFNTSEGVDEKGIALWCSRLFQGVARRLVLPGKSRSKSYSNFDLQSVDVYIENEDMLEILDQHGEGSEGYDDHYDSGFDLI